MEWFWSHLDLSDEALKPVEINHDYIFSKVYMSNIKKYAHDAKIIIFLRYPIDWLISEYNYVSAVANVNCEFDDYLRTYSYAKDRCDYSNHLLNAIELFPRENILIEFQENLSADPIKFSKKLCSFLGISDDFLVNFESHQRINSKIKPKFWFAPVIIKFLKKFFLKLGQDKIYGRLKRSKIRSIFFKKDNNTLGFDITNISNELLDWAVQKRISLEKILGEDVSVWRLREKEIINTIDRSKIN